jgi:hypothetical protein
LSRTGSDGSFDDERYGYSNSSQPSDRVQAWLGVYTNGYWPESNPQAPASGHEKLDQVLWELWNLWITVVEESKRYGRERSALWTRDNPEVGGVSSEENAGGWSPCLLCRIDHDRWAGSALEDLYRVADLLQSREESDAGDSAEAAERAAERLQELVDSVPQQEA